MTEKIYIILVLFLLSCPAFADTPWEDYMALPTLENAAKVTKIEYTKGAIPENYGYWAPDLDILRNQVLGCDKEAFRLTFRLIQKSDGGLLESLIVILSHTIRPHPKFFLEEMSALNPRRAILKSIFLMPGLEYVDRMDAQQYEIKMREKALATISDKKLNAFRAICLEIMKNK